MPVVNSYARIVDYFDNPKVFNAAIVNIPGSASPPVEVIASLVNDVDRLHVLDGIGGFIGLYKGPVGQEELVCIIGGNGGQPFISVYLKAGTRISIRNELAATITSGAITILFAKE